MAYPAIYLVLKGWVVLEILGQLIDVLREVFGKGGAIISQIIKQGLL
jgi:hypothetical protein